MIKVAVLGATGRMGQTLVRLIAEAKDLELVGAATERGDARIGEDAGAAAGAGPCGVLVTDDVAAALDAAQVAIDFTLPVAASANIAACVDSEVGLVMGTTGLSAEQHAQLQGAGSRIGVVYGRNMSVGVNVLTELVALAGQVLGMEYDVEITETHHRNKLDAPSGTALQLGEAVARAFGTTLENAAVYDRHGVSSPREPGSIGFASIRAGDIVGDHTVLFATDAEVLELSHRALDRQVFARGALRATRWLTGQSAGLYSMRDVLGLSKP